MMIRFPTAVALSATVAVPALAAPPEVATDIAPVHGLVARVMDGVATPALIVPQNASPHGYAMRPSEAAALEAAEIVIWMGPALTPWLEDPIETLAAGAAHIPLLKAEVTATLEPRQDARFEAHDHDHGADHDDDHAHGEEHGHDDHDHASGEEHAQDDHDHDHGDEHAEADDHGHSHDADVDPHAWLDPENARAWLGLIAEALAERDPDNADTYRANAEAGTAEIDAAAAEAQATLDAAGAPSFIVFHDAYQYLEGHFGVQATGAIALGDASDPGPARIAEIRETVTDSAVNCVLAEPQFDPALTRTVIDGTQAEVVVVDPVGGELPLGPGFYPALLRDIATDIAACGSAGDR